MRTFIAGVTLYLLNHYIRDGFTAAAFSIVFMGVLYSMVQDVADFCSKFEGRHRKHE